MRISESIKRKLRPVAIIALVISSLGSQVFFSEPADAAQLSQAFVRLDRMSATTGTTGRVCAKVPSATPTEASVQVTFPTATGTDYSLGLVGTWTVDVANLDAGQTPWPGILAATNVTGKTVTFPSGDLTSNTNLYCFNWTSTSALTTSSAYGSTASETTHGSITTRTVTPTNIDTGTWATYVIAGDTVSITNNAVVPPAFSFALNGTTDQFTTNLTTGAVTSTGGRTATMITNAPNGWVVWVKDSTNNGSGVGSLFSATNSKYIAGASAYSVGTASRTMATNTEDYGLGATKTHSGNGTMNLAMEYDSTANASNVGSLDPAKYEILGTSTGTALSDVITFKEKASIDGQTQAGTDYTDTITVIGAGRF